MKAQKMVVVLCAVFFLFGCGKRDLSGTYKGSQTSNLTGSGDVTVNVTDNGERITGTIVGPDGTAQFDSPRGEEASRVPNIEATLITTNLNNLNQNLNTNGGQTYPNNYNTAQTMKYRGDFNFSEEGEHPQLTTSMTSTDVVNNALMNGTSGINNGTNVSGGTAIKTITAKK